MIRSLRLLNWRSHADSLLEFRPGTNILVGIMGAGKSSILEAISFAFFGTFPALERRKAKLEDIVRLNEPVSRVVLEFDWGMSRFRIERSIEVSKRGASTSAELYKDGKLLEHGVSAVTAYLETLTQVDYDLFTRAIYSEQNNIDYFLTIDPRRRKQEMDALLGLDRFEDARANVVSVIGRFRARRDALESRFDREKLGNLRSDESALSQKASHAREAHKTLSESIEKEKGRLSSMESDLRKMESEKTEFERFSKESIRLNAIADSLKKETSSLDERAFNEKIAKLSKLEDERKLALLEARQNDSEYAALSKQSGSMEERIKSAKELIARRASLEADLRSILGTGSLDSLSALMAEYGKELLDAEASAKSLQHEIKEIEDLAPRLRTGLGRCPLCSSVLDESALDHIRNEKRALLTEKKKALSELDRHHKVIKEKNDALSLSMKKATVISAQLLSIEKGFADPAALSEGRERLSQDLSRLKEKKAVFDKRIVELSNSIESLKMETNKARVLLEKKKELDAIARKIIETAECLKALGFDPAGYESRKKAAESIRLDLTRTISLCSSNESELRNMDAMLKMQREEIAALALLEKDIAALSRLEEELSVFKNALISTQTSLRQALIEAINGAMNDIWPIFYPYRNYSALRLEVTDRDYMFEVDDQGSWKSLESMASGGERASAALTLRVALAMVLTPQLGWLILDEPTHNLDKEAVGFLSDAFQAKIPSVVSQAFIITHEEGLMGSEFASSYRLTRDKSRNGATIVEEI